MTNPLPALLLPCFYCQDKGVQADQTFNTPSRNWIICKKCGYCSSSQFKSQSDAREAHNHIYRCIDEASLRILRKEDYWKRNDNYDGKKI